MILSPVQNTGKKVNGEWTQERPRVTQYFGERPEVYEQFGLRGHEGIDIGPNGDRNIFAPFEGVVKVRDDGPNGYGLHIRIRDGRKEVILAHLEEVYVVSGQRVYTGDKIALMGTSGFSSGVHLHMALRFTYVGPAFYPSVFDLQVKNYDNGYKGFENPFPYLIWWKGAGQNTTHDTDAHTYPSTHAQN